MEKMNMKEKNLTKNSEKLLLEILEILKKQNEILENLRKRLAPTSDEIFGK